MGTKIHSYKERYNLENYTQEVFENIKGVIRIDKSEKDRQHNAKRKVQRDKHRSTKHTYKTKD